MKRIAMALVICGMGLGWFPANSLAGDVYETLDTLHFAASPSGASEQNQVTVAVGSQADPRCAPTASPCYLVTDTGVNPVAKTACVATADPTTVACDLVAAIVLAYLDLGDLDDSATVNVSLPTEVLGQAGNDTVNSGPANDILRGKEGADVLRGGGGNDTIYGNDVLTFGAPDGHNVLEGGDGVDTIEGGGGGNTIDGGNEADVLFGQGGADRIAGGDGNDRLSGGDGDDTLLGENGDDIVGARDQLGATPVLNERGNDTMDGGPGQDTLQAGLGPLLGASDSDTFAGGPGVDLVLYDQRSADVAVSTAGLRNDGVRGEGDDVQQSTENVTSGSGADTLRGSPDLNALQGGAGDDEIDGVGGNDHLGGAGGDDDLRGGDGVDVIDGGGGEDYLDGGAGADELSGGGASDTTQSRDRRTDTVDCADPTDFAIADRADRLASCQRKDVVPADKPVLNRTIAIDPERRTGLEVGLPGAKRLVPLEVHVNAPSGSRVDATKGPVRITSVGRSGGAKGSARRVRYQKATFKDGPFQVRQRRADRGKTDISLRGDFDACVSTRSAATALRFRAIRRLWANTRGRFRVRGRYVATTVRGTRWVVEDGCSSSRVRVLRGRVNVLDVVRGRTVAVRAPRSYVVKAP